MIILSAPGPLILTGLGLGLGLGGLGIKGLGPGLDDSHFTFDLGLDYE